MGGPADFFTYGNSVKCQTISLLLKEIVCENSFAFNLQANGPNGLDLNF